MIFSENQGLRPVDCSIEPHNIKQFEKRQMPNREYAFIKIVGGKTSYTLPDDG